MTHLESRRRAAVLMVLLGLSAALVLQATRPAVAQNTAKPQPGCAGLAAGDAADDSASGENTEILGFFFRTVGSRTTANIQVKNLTTEVPPTATGLNWYVVWDTGEALRYVEAAVDLQGGPTFGYGTFDDATGYSQEGETGGRFHEGADGVIEIQVPAELGAGRGKTLADPYATATEAIGALGFGVVGPVDSAPDEGGGADYVVQPCEASPSPTPGAAPGPAASLPVTVVTKSAKARSTRKRKLAVKVRSSEPVQELRARLVKRSKTVGRGKRRTLDGTAKLRLALTRKLKKGTYVLELTGTAGGSERSTTAKLKIR